MTRRWLTAVLAVPTLALAVVVGGASGASAKGPTDLVIDGPGLDEPITVGSGEDRRPPFVHDVLEASGGAELLYTDAAHPRPKPPAGALGPRYTLAFADPGGTLLVQEVYPFAAAGPLSYTPPGQPGWDGRPLPSGWNPPASALRTHLTALGVPAPAPSSAPTTPSSAPTTAAPVSKAKVSSAASETDAAGTRSSATTLWLGAAALVTSGAGVGAGTLLVRRRRGRLRAET